MKTTKTTTLINPLFPLPLRTAATIEDANWGEGDDSNHYGYISLSPSYMWRWPPGLLEASCTGPNRSAFIPITHVCVIPRHGIRFTFLFE